MCVTDIHDLVRETYELLKTVVLIPVPTTGLLGHEFNFIWVSYMIKYPIWKENQFKFGFF